MKEDRVCRKGLVFGMLFLLILLVFNGLLGNASAEKTSFVLEEWVASYNGPANKGDIGNAIALDSYGNVYVTGLCKKGSSYDYATIKYDPSGNEVWVKHYNDPNNFYDEAVAIVIDHSLERVYVTGQSWYFRMNLPYYIFNSLDYYTIAYDFDGNELWSARYWALGWSQSNARDIAVDESTGNIYVTGDCKIYESRLSPEIPPHYRTVAYDSDGNELWVSTYHGITDDKDLAAAIAIGPSGDVYVTGRSDGGSVNDYDYATVAYEPVYGNEQWVMRYNGPGNDDDEPNAIAVDYSSGNVYVAGFSENVGYYEWDFTTIAYSSSGTQLWVKRYDGPYSDVDIAYDIVVDQSSGNVYVTGSMSYSYNNPDFVTIAYDSNGNQLWLATYGSPEYHKQDYARAIALDSSGNVYVSGISDGGSTGYDYATVAYNSEGTELWSARYSGSGSNSDVPKDIAADSNGNVYVTGMGFNTLTTNDIITIKYTQNPISVVENIIEDVEELNLPSGTETGLIIKLEIAINSLDSDQKDYAVNLLEAFINQVEAQRGKKLTDAQADELIAAAKKIIHAIDNSNK